MRSVVGMVVLALSACDGGMTDADAGEDAAGTDGASCECDDGLFCNGVESCGASGCVAGTAPCDGDCNEDVDVCVTACTTDADADGVRAIECGGSDCDDADPERFPGASERCDAEDVDEDCDPSTFGFRDADGDGAPDAACCNVDDDGNETCGVDCNDVAPGVSPSAAEVCNARDDDCDGVVDEDVLLTFYLDADGDGYGSDDPADLPTRACFEPEGYAATNDDCDDDASTGAAVHPGAADVCDTMDVDDNCDGTPNNPPGGCTCTGTATQACPEPGVCAGGVETCIGGAWSPCSIMRQPEACDGRDEDCDGTVDDGVLVTCFPDADGDDYAASGAMPQEVCPVAGNACPVGLTDRAPLDPELDCDDDRRASNPGAAEACNTIDDDCDGRIDEATTIGCWTDTDNDTFAPSGAPRMQLCPDSARVLVGGCPLGFTNREPVSAGDADCDDGSGAVRPGASEICNTRDDDCNGMTDEGVSIACYADGDGDGYATLGATATMRCACGAGETANAPTPSASDCADGNPAVSPAATETCNGVDDNCNGTTDESGASATYYRDADGDGHGTLGMPMSGISCTAPPGYSIRSDDCDDADMMTYPGAIELCDRVDRNCSSGGGTAADEDLDGDMHAPIAASCSGGYPRDDCNDTSAAIRPGAAETTGDEVDSDCNGMETCWSDADSDGYRDRANTTRVSSDPDCSDAGEAATSGASGDCDDTSPSINPGAMEVIGDGVDQDCEGHEICYVDLDNDGYRTNATLDSNDADCSDAGEAVPSDPSGDCDDTSSTVRPGAPEITGDQIDQNCDGAELCYRDMDGDGYRTTMTVPSSDADCTDNGEAPASATSGDCNDNAMGVYPGATEITANGVDENCDTFETCHVDADDDGYRLTTTVSSTDSDCDDPGEALASEPSGDCNDMNPSVSPGDPEVGDNAINDDCDGFFGCFPDADSDGYRPNAGGSTVNDTSVDSDCADAGEGQSSEPATDCNDMNANVSPGDPEIADNGINDDCDGFHGCFPDADSDGYRPTVGGTTVNDTSVDPDCMDAGEGQSTEPATDCDDGSGATYPGAPEPCNRVNNNCDANDARSEDGDGDMHAPTGTTVCSGGYLADDCQDGDAAIYTGAPEPCNRVDNNCSSGGTTDANEDFDSDLHAPTGTLICSGGYPRDDCRDMNNTIYTGAFELCDHLDNNCSAGGGFEAEICYASQTLLTGTGSEGVGIADFDNDGDLDIATSYTSGNSIATFLNNGSGGFGAPVVSTTGIAAGPSRLVTGRFDSDTRWDVAVVHPNSFGVYAGNGAGGFTPISGAPFPFPLGTTARGLSAGRINGDTNDDVALNLTSANQATIWLWDTGTSRMVAAAGSPFAAGMGPYESNALARFNADAFLDLALNTASENSVYVFLGNGAGGMSAASGSPFAFPARVDSVAAGDVNGDGYADIVATRGDGVTANHWTMLSNGAGGFSPATSNTVTALGFRMDSLLADMDLDGDLDHAATTNDRRTLTLYRNDGGGAFSQFSNPGAACGTGYATWLAAGDLDADGYPDFAVSAGDCGVGVFISLP